MPQTTQATPAVAELWPDDLRAPEIPLDPMHCRITWKRADKAALLLFALFWIAYLSALIWVRARFPDVDHGDSFSDASIITSGWNYSAHGFSTHAGLPQVYSWYKDRPSEAVYSHFPPGPNWLHYAWLRAGFTELSQLRTIALLFSGAAGLLVCAFGVLLTGSGVVGALTGFFYLWSVPFAEYSDSLHEHAYMQLTLFGFLVCWLAFERSRTVFKRRAWLVLACLFFLLDWWVTLEHAPFVGTFAAGRALLTRRREVLGACILIFVVGCLGFGSRVVHNSIALGGLGAAVRDFHAAAEWRGGHGAEGPSFEQLVEVWNSRFYGRTLPLDHYDAEFRYPLLKRSVRYPAMALISILLCTWHWHGQAPAKRALLNAVLLLVAGSVWLVVMKEHSVVHRHLIMLFLPGGALLMAALAGAGFLTPTEPLAKSAPVRWFGPTAAVALMIGFGGNMRESTAMNQFDAAVHRKAHRIVQQRRESNAAFRRAGQRLTDVEHLYIVGTYPLLSATAGLPFSYVAAGTLPQLRPGEAAWIQLWGDPDRVNALHGCEKYGFPDMLTPPSPVEVTSMIFRGERRFAHDIDVQFEGGIAITDLRLTETLDGSGRLVQSRIVCVGQDADLSGVSLHCEVLDEHDQVAGAADCEALQPAGGPVITWNGFPVREWPLAARLRISLRRGAAPLGVVKNSLVSTGTQPAGPVRPAPDAFIWSPTQ